MLGNIWLSSALIIVAIYSASSVYKSYSDTQEAKQIQENYKIISDIKTLLANQYNKNPDEVTRDEIMMHLPVGGNWEKVLLLNRNKSSNMDNDSDILVDENGDFVLNESEQLKLFALRAKLQNLSISNTEEIDGTKHTFQVGMIEKNIVMKNQSIEKSVEKAIEYLTTAILYETPTVEPTIAELTSKLVLAIDTYIPYSDIYQDMTKDSDGVTPLTDAQVKERKKEYFQKRIKEKLILNENAMKTKLYYYLKDEL